MMTIAQLTVREVEDIYLDLDDSGFMYLKQGDDWISFPQHHLAELVRLLSEQVPK